MTSIPDPYEVVSDPDRPFWADAVADAIEAREPDDPIVIKGGVSPSGIPHIGHFNEILRGYFVAAVLRERGHEVRQVFTADDRDRLRAIPRRLADPNWKLVELGDIDAGALGRNLGRPYTDVPDPFETSDSYGDHFTSLLRESVSRLDIDIEFVSNTALYERGEFDDVIERILSQADFARETISPYQEGIDESYVPFFPICESCGHVTEAVRDFDLDAWTISYTCTDVQAGDQIIEGCGHEGTTSLRNGKLPWRFEWPAQWAHFGVDFEPFGKDHAEGSWPSGVAIAQSVLDIEPPIPMVYEWFTLDGDALSSSSGNVVTVDEVLDLLEPEVLRYFFAKDPLKQRDFSIQHLDHLVDEFDQLEQRYFDTDPSMNQQAEVAQRVYPLLVDDVRPERFRIPYTFAAVLGMTDDPDIREEIARKEGHIPTDAPDWAVEDALDRVALARNWARRTGNEFDYELKRTEMPDISVEESVAEALDDLADFIAAGHDGTEIQSEIFALAEAYDIEPAQFFAAGYRLFFDEDQGPKLGPFLAKLDRDFVVDRLRRVR